MRVHVGVGGVSQGQVLNANVVRGGVLAARDVDQHLDRMRIGDAYDVERGCFQIHEQGTMKNENEE